MFFSSSCWFHFVVSVIFMFVELANVIAILSVLIRN
jgi:hypothetical protein